ncbi:MAG: hypothetical protein EPN23_07645 [Verrucomicrobia bacterium]|nr:MAG: hypothetical protein EPN23_07645 [Verrucomicrobiota bacterium]
MHKIFFSSLLLVTLTCSAKEPIVYVGGVAGIASLTEGSASQKFRVAGGGLYLHNNGWASLNQAQQQQVLAHFAGHPVGIELGYGTGHAAQAWATRCKTGYLDLGIHPTFITANAFDGNNLPTVEGWQNYTAALRQQGVPEATLILPTFEYANFGPNIATLSKNMVSQRTDFQAIISLAGGIVLDCPPGFFFSREENYRAWMLDALRWTHAKGLKCVWITSPHASGVKFGTDTERCLKFFQSQGIMPDMIAVENYTANPPPGYVNVVGREDIPATALGVGWDLVNRILPSLKASAPVQKKNEPKPESSR